MTVNDTTNPGDASSRDTSSPDTNTHDVTPIDSIVPDAARPTVDPPDWVTVGQVPAGDAPATRPDPAADTVERPTIRWGALVWSLLFGATAGFILWVLLDPARRLAVGEWLTTLNPLAAALYALVGLGVVLAMFGIVGLIRRGERAGRA
jgi:hypothetical protein